MATIVRPPVCSQSSPGALQTLYEWKKLRTPFIGPDVCSFCSRAMFSQKFRVCMIKIHKKLSFERKLLGYERSHYLNFAKFLHDPLNSNVNIYDRKLSKSSENLKNIVHSGGSLMSTEHAWKESSFHNHPLEKSWNGKSFEAFYYNFSWRMKKFSLHHHIADVWRKLQENKRETLCTDVYVQHSGFASSASIKTSAGGKAWERLRFVTCNDRRILFEAKLWARNFADIEKFAVENGFELKSHWEKIAECYWTEGSEFPTFYTSSKFKLTSFHSRCFICSHQR